MHMCDVCCLRAAQLRTRPLWLRLLLWWPTGARRSASGWAVSGCASYSCHRGQRRLQRYANCLQGCSGSYMRRLLVHALQCIATGHLNRAAKVRAAGFLVPQVPCMCTRICRDQLSIHSIHTSKTHLSSFRRTRQRCCLVVLTLPPAMC
jgi:hypothetical protein